MARESLDERPRNPAARSSSRRPARESSAASNSVPPRNRRRLPPRPSVRDRGARIGQACRGAVSAAGNRLRGLGARLRRPGVMLLKALMLCASLAGVLAVGRMLQNHLTTSKAFAVETIEVSGLQRVSQSELLLAAGIAVGDNVFADAPEVVRERLLKHPWIAHAEVLRTLPGRFDIKVREREPAAILLVEACNDRDGQNADASCDEPSSLYLVSDEGTVFKRVEGQDPVDLPVITGVDRQRLGADPEFRGNLVLKALALLSDYRSAGLWQSLPIGEIHVEPNNGFSIYVGEDLTLVRLGHSPFDQKLRRMKKVFDRLARERASAEYVYLDNERRPDRVTVRLR